MFSIYYIDFMQCRYAISFRYDLVPVSLSLYIYLAQEDALLKLLLSNLAMICPWLVLGSGVVLSFLVKQYVLVLDLILMK